MKDELIVFLYLKYVIVFVFKTYFKKVVRVCIGQVSFIFLLRPLHFITLFHFVCFFKTFSNIMTYTLWWKMNLRYSELQSISSFSDLKHFCSYTFVVATSQYSGIKCYAHILILGSMWCLSTWYLEQLRLRIRECSVVCGMIITITDALQFFIAEVAVEELLTISFSLPSLYVHLNFHEHLLWRNG